LLNLALNYLKNNTMKNISLVLAICFSFLTIAQAQIPPQAFNYSAVARNSTGQPIVSTTIGVQISILKSSATGSVQYSENHFVVTDAFGLFNLVIGTGAVQSGSMAAINWSNDNYYLKVGMDVNGSTNFITMGTTQLLSVPYALHAKTAESISGSGSGTGGNFTHYIGEAFGGGVIFHLWKDAQGVEHGLIVDKVDLITQPWSNVSTTLIGPTAQSTWDGLSNSNAIVAQTGHTNSTAALCLNSTNGGQTDWYLPAIDEMSLMWQNRYNINRSLSLLPGATLLPSLDYQSSTEHDANYYKQIDFGLGATNIGGKAFGDRVRAVRAF
jgi:hypothetical protein